MRKNFCHFALSALLFLSSAKSFSQLPFELDKLKLYKNIYPDELCRMLNNDPDILLLDVRDQGEYSDTSHNISQNMGRLKNSVNIDIMELPKKISELNAYKNKNVIVYCSHSNRSRRAAKLLTENGFTSVYNLNGGMSVIHRTGHSLFPCKDEWVQSSLSYKHVSFTEAIDLIKKEKQLVIIDVRSPLQYTGLDTSLENNVGRLKKAINIPFDQLESKLDELISKKNNPVLVYDLTGVKSAEAAKKLSENGFTKVYNLFDGLVSFIQDYEPKQVKAVNFLEKRTAYNLLGVKAAEKFILSNAGAVIIDTRSATAYERKGNNPIINIGVLKKAINIQPSDFIKVNEVLKTKNTPVLVYGNQEVFAFCKKLTESGYKNVNIIYSGVYAIRWSAANLEDCKSAGSILSE